METVRRHGRMRRLTGLVLTVAAICSALVLRAHRSSSASEHQTPTLAPVVAVAEPHSRNQLESAHFSPATNSPSSKYPLVVPGFVLQVGAMTNEKNAEALSERLQRKHFPTFVFKRSTDRFYQVDVGSFADVDSAAVVKRELEKRGFKPILRYWSPS